MLGAEKIQLTLDRQQPATKSKIVSLLRRYNATMGFNPQENLFEVDLEVKFNNTEERDKFLRAYFAKMRASSRPHTVLEEIQTNVKADELMQQAPFEELRREKKMINSVASRKLKEFKQDGVIAPSSSRQQIGGMSNTNRNVVPNSKFAYSQQFNEPVVEPLFPDRQARRVKQNPSDELDYREINKNIEICLNNAFRMLYNQADQYRSGSQQNSIKIVEEEPPEGTYNNSVQNTFASPSTIKAPQSSDRSKSSTAKQLNYELEQDHVSDYPKYNLDDIIEQENPSELESEADIDRKKHDHFRFLEERLKGPAKVVKKRGVQPSRQSAPFDQQRFRQFIDLQKRKIDDLFSSAKKSFYTSYSSSSSTKKAGNHSKPQEDIELWREQLNISSGKSAKDQSELFSKRFYETFESRITAQNKYMSSTDLVNYFRFLISHAKKLYVGFLKGGSLESTKK